MTETIRYSQLGKQDIRSGSGTFEIALADGRVVVLDEFSFDNTTTPLILASPNGTKFRLEVDNNGTLTVVAV